MIRVKLTLQMLQTLLHTNPSHQDEPFQSIKPKVWPKLYQRGKKLGRNEHKLTRHKCHLHFNLRCLSQNIVPKGVKLNIKQFSTFQERRIICKTHRSILNSQVRQCNRIINKLQSHINKIKTSIKNKSNNKDFIDIVDVIHKSKEKVFKITKNCQIKKFNHL